MIVCLIYISFFDNCHDRAIKFLVRYHRFERRRATITSFSQFVIRALFLFSSIPRSISKVEFPTKHENRISFRETWEDRENEVGGNRWQRFRRQRDIYSDFDAGESYSHQIRDDSTVIHLTSFLQICVPMSHLFHYCCIWTMTWYQNLPVTGLNEFHLVSTTDSQSQFCVSDMLFFAK